MTVKREVTSETESENLTSETMTEQENLETSSERDSERENTSEQASVVIIQEENSELLESVQILTDNTDTISAQITGVHQIGIAIAGILIICAMYRLISSWIR